MMNRDQTGEAPKRAEFNPDHADLADRWILSRLNSTLSEVHAAFAAYEVNKAAKMIYDFIWHDFCDWYVEMIKSRLYGDEPAPVKQAVVSRALDVYDAALRLLHPIMPFVTEELWQTIRARTSGETIMRSRIPAADGAMIDVAVEKQMTFVQNVIEAVRGIRGEMSIAPSREISLVMKTGSSHPPDDLRRYEGYLQRLARVMSLSFLEASAARPKLSATAVVEGEELFVPLEGLIDLGVERGRLQKEIDRIEGVLRGIRGKLGNASFVEKAPADVVAKEKEKLSSFETNIGKLRESLRRLTE
jgi:valyl-tRNA synthetase